MRHWESCGRCATRKRNTARLRSMRFADLTRRFGLLGALCAALSGCAGVAGPKPAPAPQVPAGAAPGAVSARQKETPSGITPAVQREFENAVDALNAGHPDEAARSFLELTRAQPELGGPHANLGIIYLQTGKQAEAVAELEQAVQLNPQ